MIARGNLYPDRLFALYTLTRRVYTIRNITEIMLRGSAKETKSGENEWKGKEGVTVAASRLLKERGKDVSTV